jgi:ABC-2 type transport system ATP-binding protein
MNAALSLHAVTKQQGQFQLGPLTLDVPRGAVLAFVGPNGAGKTTTLDMLMGMGRADGGRVTVLGLEWPRDEVAIKARTAYVNPDMNFQPWGTVGRVLDFVSGFYPDWSAQRCEALLEKFGVARRERIAALSFGARMKVALVAALARDAELLLLDEPTTGLDVAARLALFEEILTFVKREDRTVIISSHQLTDLERLADHVAILAQGRLLSMGPMDALVERYRAVDVRTTSTALPDGAKLMARDGDRARLLVDLQVLQPDALAQPGLEVLAQAPMTLEEIFVALTGAP